MAATRSQDTFLSACSASLEGEVQAVTRRGRQAVVIISYEEYERLQAGTKSAWDVFVTAPRLAEEDLPLARDKAPMHPIELV